MNGSKFPQESASLRISPRSLVSDRFRNAAQGMNEFGYNTREELIQERASLFGFLVGASIGDAGKHVKGELRFPSKALSIVLSTK